MVYGFEYLVGQRRRRKTILLPVVERSDGAGDGGVGCREKDVQTYGGIYLSISVV